MFKLSQRPQGLTKVPDLASVTPLPWDPLTSNGYGNVVAWPSTSGDGATPSVARYGSAMSNTFVNATSVVVDGVSAPANAVLVVTTGDMANGVVGRVVNIDAVGTVGGWRWNWAGYGMDLWSAQCPVAFTNQPVTVHFDRPATGRVIVSVWTGAKNPLAYSLGDVQVYGISATATGSQWAWAANSTLISTVVYADPHPPVVAPNASFWTPLAGGKVGNGCYMSSVYMTRAALGIYGPQPRTVWAPDPVPPTRTAPVWGLPAAVPWVTWTLGLMTDVGP